MNQAFSANRVEQISALDGVRAAAGGLTLVSIHIEGTVPSQTTQPQFRVQGPRNIDTNAISISGVDQRYAQLGAVTSGQLSRGRYFSASSTKREAILNLSYARRKGQSIEQVERWLTPNLAYEPARC